MKIIVKNQKIREFQDKLKDLKNSQILSSQKQAYFQLGSCVSSYLDFVQKKGHYALYEDSKVLYIRNPLLKKKLLKKPEKKLEKRSTNKSKSGILYLKRGKRNIFLTLCNSRNRLVASLSYGYLKFKGTKLKSKARKATYNLKKLAHILVGLILKTKFEKLYLKFKTSFPKRVKRIFLRILGYKRKKFKIYKLSRYRTKPHNGCRRPKIRRK